MNFVSRLDHDIFPQEITNELAFVLGKIEKGQVPNEQDLLFLQDDQIATKYQDWVVRQLISNTKDARLQFKIAAQIIRNTLWSYGYSDILVLMYIARLFPNSLARFEDVEKFMWPPVDRISSSSRQLFAIILWLPAYREPNGGESSWREIHDSCKDRTNATLGN